MGFYGVVKVNETGKLNAPYVHQGADDPLGFTVGSRTIDAGKLLIGTV